MGIKKSFKRGLREGHILRYLRKYDGGGTRHLKNIVYSDIKKANDELIDYLINIENKTLFGVIDAIQLWLDLHSKVTGFKGLKYNVGDGDNLFKLVEVEKEINSRLK